MSDSIEVLMVEDNPADIELTQEALSQGKLKNKLHIVFDGEQALDFLFKRGDYVDAISPDVVLLDLNLPKMIGREVLAEIKSDEKLSSIPVVILSSSSDIKDIQSSYSLNANIYVTKPVKVEDFLEVVRKIEDFWIDVVKLPSGKNSQL